MSEFTKLVKDLMDRDKLSQKELANLTGISESSISRYISGALKPRMDVLAKISKVFGVSTSYLIGEERNEYIPHDAFEETLCIVTRNKSKLDDNQKAEIIKVLFGGK